MNVFLIFLFICGLGFTHRVAYLMGAAKAFKFFHEALDKVLRK